MSLEKAEIKRIIETALHEDIGAGDVTSDAVLSGKETGRARALAKADMLIAGMDVFKAVFVTVDPDIRFTPRNDDGSKAKNGTILAGVKGNLRSILKAERVALNLFQRMCGIATLTRQYADLVKGTQAKILDTRKTVPGLRILDKYAVRIGGGYNHRHALYDGILIKDNHITAAGGIIPAVTRAAAATSPLLKIEVEVKNLSEVKDALAVGAHMIMLDNMTIGAIKQAVRLIAGRVCIEVSGNVSLQNVRAIAETGVDFISIGALTHSVAAADISLKITAAGQSV
jgi:nicotinate-nucleotide pyrophosphorylase (carboxylating)